MNSGDDQVSNLRFRPRKGQAMRVNRDKRCQIKAHPKGYCRNAWNFAGRPFQRNFTQRRRQKIRSGKGGKAGDQTIEEVPRPPEVRRRNLGGSQAKSQFPQFHTPRSKFQTQHKKRTRARRILLFKFIRNVTYAFGCSSADSSSSGIFFITLRRP